MYRVQMSDGRSNEGHESQLHYKSVLLIRSRVSRMCSGVRGWNTTKVSDIGRADSLLSDIYTQSCFSFSS